MIWKDAEMNLEDYAKGMDGIPEKFSRREFKDLTHSIILTADGKFVPQYHKTASSIHTHQLSDIATQMEIFL